MSDEASVCADLGDGKGLRWFSPAELRREANRRYVEWLRQSVEAEREVEQRLRRAKINELKEARMKGRSKIYPHRRRDRFQFIPIVVVIAFNFGWELLKRRRRASRG